MTTASVAYNSVLSMPLNTLLKSAAYPSGPVTCEARPSAWDWVIARMELAAAAAPFHPCLPTLTATMVCIALPSADTTGPVTWSGPAPCNPANLRASAAALARSAAVSPEARSYPTTAGKMFGDWKRDCTSRTLVDSALAGSHVFASFFSAPISFDDSGAAITSTTTQKPTTTHLVQLPAGISAIFPSLPISSPGSVGGQHRASGCRPQDQLSGWSDPAPSSRSLCPVAAVPASGRVRCIQMRISTPARFSRTSRPCTTPPSGGGSTTGVAFNGGAPLFATTGPRPRGRQLQSLFIAGPHVHVALCTLATRLVRQAGRR